jgi:hypothetical protein
VHVQHNKFSAQVENRPRVALCDGPPAIGINYQFEGYFVFGTSILTVVSPEQRGYRPYKVSVEMNEKPMIRELRSLANR